jgi:Family of unknown function (DUF6117)
MEAAMAIPDHARKNFQTLLRAAEAGHLALMECTDAATSEVRYVLCALCRYRHKAHNAALLVMPRESLNVLDCRGLSRGRSA